MTTKEALFKITKEFSDYSFHPLFLKELSELLKHDLNGKETQFFKCMYSQLTYIHTLGTKVNKADSHEIIHGFDGHFYSIHIQQKQFNIRFLVHIDNEGAPVFLCAFYERKGHKQTGYDRYTEVLASRYKEISGD